MASFSQQPYQLNGSYTNLLYVANSVSSSQPQFQYVLDIYESGSNELLSRIKQYPNPSDVAVFDTSRIMNDYLEYPTSFTLNVQTQTTNTQVKTFTVKLGEEYGTSPSSSVTLYPGQASTEITVSSAVVDPNQDDIIPAGLTGYDWPYAKSLKLMTDRPSGIPIVGSYDNLYQSIYLGEPGLPATGSLLFTRVDENGNETPLIISNLTANSNLERFTTFNITGNGTDYPYGIRLTVQETGETILYPYDTNACNYDRVNFSFINNYGFWDSYGFNLPTRKTTTINRREITKPFVNYSSPTSPYDYTRRGKDLFNTYLTDNITITTPWLTKEEADWLTQLMESPEVYIQNTPKGINSQNETYNAVMVPIVITNSNYTHNTNTRSQKKFQYEIQYQYANQRRGR